MMLDRMPDGAFGEGEARADLADRGIDIDELLEFRTQRRVGHARLLRPGTSCGSGPIG